MTMKKMDEADGRALLKEQMAYYSDYLAKEYERERRAKEYENRIMQEEWDRMFDGWELVLQRKENSR